MSNFINIANRLKLALGVTTDMELAEFLELKPNAFAGRKKRNSFPTERLSMILQKHPRLDIDFDYVVNGAKSKTNAEQIPIIITLTQGELNALNSLLTQCVAKHAQKSLDHTTNDNQGLDINHVKENIL
ncbi:Uncharacterised protein [Moraxella lacunata]|uniref:Bacteriophage CI repressor N-terminal domain-containing protein n=1 Tax=Moraxella lacunata TaxID=477 RepID=A0A378TW01_MORLA|nr:MULTISPECIES: helix-turn-helix domain-containing protein [Moraxella]UZA23864.1 helix-turn-helix domain containing protein [Moraxella bovis]UZA30117.1 helix-turn-helix domain containing protein [Moraxella bovis]STZ63933.1 Uncharacterised protein [Moraxella lacunata]